MITQEPLDDHYPPASSAASQLFTVRVWVESAHDESVQVRVQVKYVLSGATRTFREWSQVVAFIEARLQDSEADPRSGAVEGCGFRRINWIALRGPKSNLSLVPQVAISEASTSTRLSE